jgi:hypothetical protein
MPRHSQTFYYLGSNIEEMQKYLQNEPGYAATKIRALYADEQLTEEIGTYKTDMVLVDNTKSIPVFDIVKTIVTSEGTIVFIYVREHYEELTVQTEETSGVFTKGTVIRSYVTSDKAVRKIIYTSDE